MFIISLESNRNRFSFLRNLNPVSTLSEWNSSEKQAANMVNPFGKARLYVNGNLVAEGPMRAQTGKFTLAGDGLCVGYDSGDAVSQEYASPGEFHGGTILGVGVTVEKIQYVDLKRGAETPYARISVTAYGSGLDSRAGRCRPALFLSGEAVTQRSSHSSANFLIASKCFTIALALFFPKETQCQEISELGASTVGTRRTGFP